MSNKLFEPHHNNIHHLFMSIFKSKKMLFFKRQKSFCIVFQFKFYKHYPQIVNIMPKKKLQSFLVYINLLLYCKKVQEQLLALLHKKQPRKKSFKQNTKNFYVDDFMMTSKENDIVLNFNE